MKLNAKDYRVEVIPLSVGLELVKKYHYSRGGSNTATYRHGLIERKSGRVVGVALWIPPTKTAAMSNYRQGDWTKVLSLSRLAIDPSVPKNGASFLLGASERMIKRDGKYEYLLTYADEWRGHTGAIYRATNWNYLGKTAPEDVWVNSKGRMMGRKRGQKTLTRSDMERLGFVNQGKYAKHRFGKYIGRTKPKEKT